MSLGRAEASGVEVAAEAAEAVAALAAEAVVAVAVARPTTNLFCGLCCVSA